MSKYQYDRAPQRFRPPTWTALFVVAALASLLFLAIGGLVGRATFNPVTTRSGSTSQGDTTIFGSLDVQGETTLHGPLVGNVDDYIWMRDSLVIEGDGTQPQLTVRGQPNQTEPLLLIQEISGDPTTVLDYAGNLTVTGNIELANGLYALGAPEYDVKVIGSLTETLTITGTHTIWNFNPFVFSGFYAGGCSLAEPPTVGAASCAITGALWPEDQGDASGFQIVIRIYDSATITPTLSTLPVAVHWYALVRP